MEQRVTLNKINLLNGGDFHRYSLFGVSLLVSGATGAIYQLDQIGLRTLTACATLADSTGGKGNQAPPEDKGDVGAGEGVLDPDTTDLLSLPDSCLQALWGPFLGRSTAPALLRETLAELGEIAAEEQELAARYAEVEAQQCEAFSQGDFTVKSLCLHLAHDCNLRCRYCFAGTGPFGGDRTLMPLAVGKQALDFLLKASGSRHHLEVDFFGGEPLLNWPIAKELVAYGRSRAQALGKEIKFTLTTNALLLRDEILDFLQAEGISLILSLDGRPEVHDRMRPFPGGAASHALVLARIREAIARPGLEYWVRGTYTRYNLDFCRDVASLLEQGITNISLEPVVAAPEEPYALREEDLPALAAEYEKLTALYLERQALGRPFNFFHFNFDLAQGPCLVKRMLGCGAGHEYLAVAPDGTLYPCHQFVGQKDFQVGTVFTGCERAELQREFRTAHVFSKEECRQCWARFYCSGGCHASALASGGDLRKPYRLGCALEKKRLECAFVIQALVGERKAGAA